MVGAEVREHSIERFTTFADAVVAIAITLLAIPLLEHADAAGEGLGRWWAVSSAPLLGLLISFAVIARLWWAHHRVYEHVLRWRGALVWFTFAWLLSIVLLSIATAVTTAPDRAEGAHQVDQRWQFPLYVGVMVLCSALLAAQAWVVHRHPEVTDGRGESLLGVSASLTATGAFLVVALVGTAIGAVAPHSENFAFLLMALTRPVGRGIRRRLERRRSA